MKRRSSDAGATGKRVSGPVLKPHVWLQDLEHSRGRSRLLTDQRESGPTDEAFAIYMGGNRMHYHPLVTAANWVRRFSGTPFHKQAAEQVKAWLERNRHLLREKACSKGKR